jgi:hypothetical protein
MNCKFCNKSFKRKGNLEKHILLCQETHNLIQKKKFKIREKSGVGEKEDVSVEVEEKKDVKEKEYFDDDNIQDLKNGIPSRRQLYELLQVMVNKYTVLENEMREVKKYIERTKKKINVIDWLNENMHPPIDYLGWKDNMLQITQADLEYVFKYKYARGVSLILKKYLPLENSENHPLCCFKQKSNVFYKYDGNHWTLLNQTHIIGLLTNINTKLTREFYKWKEDNQEKIDNDDRFHEIYIENMRAVLGDNKSLEEHSRVIKSQVFEYLNMDIKNIIEFEFSV